MTAKDIQALLEKYHSGELYISECKTGPTWGGRPSRFDGLFISKSWGHPCVRGYEIKVSRSDFFNDNKWRSYLDYCNEFYFICPFNLIREEEVGDAAGLMYVSKNLSRIYTRKKAPFRTVEIPLSLYLYILFSRIKIIDEDNHNSKVDYWRRWLKERKLDRQLGKSVGRALREEIKKRVLKADNENKRAKKEIEHFKEIKGYFENIGYDPKNICSWNYKKQLGAALSGVPEDLVNSVKNTIKEASKLLKHLEDLSRRGGKQGKDRILDGREWNEML